MRALFVFFILDTLHHRHRPLFLHAKTHRGQAAREFDDAEYTPPSPRKRKQSDDQAKPGTSLSLRVYSCVCVCGDAHACRSGEADQHGYVAAYKLKGRKDGGVLKHPR